VSVARRMDQMCTIRSLTNFNLKLITFDFYNILILLCILYVVFCILIISVLVVNLQLWSLFLPLSNLPTETCTGLHGRLVHVLKG